ncbi:Dihydrofolate reductase [Fulvivirga imtechensis AK7]|uniref:Dihydrofolate reductase n=1 Tax=Fulvivirga imtechensis AK7 TaxID=1237149 RepID=L8JUC0_9BACT|nr:dihydrofolate reductase family protein [Fulvivirga imtechensis]ELR72606.1 Dihydrofolate reductase [Fulvivirga imtechensis AK7]
MRKIIYYVATSLDGFIAGPDDDVSAFIQQGAGVDQYFKDLQAFDTVIMGRRTYEFGYKYGLQPGQPAYPHMEHYIFSDTLELETPHEKVKVEKRDINRIMELKAGAGADIYLSGGGEFAGWLLDHNMIDRLKIKLNPIILGRGIKLFGSSSSNADLQLLETLKFDDGFQIMTFNVR